MKARLPKNEAARLAALHKYHILDTLLEQAFDDLTLLATQICDTPIALVTLIDRDRQWFKSKRGIDVEETSRNLSFCNQALCHPEELLIVPDALLDERFVDHPSVTAGPQFRFYAGAPLATSTGEVLGMLWVVDRMPRTLSESQQQSLRALARQTMAQLEVRRYSNELANQLAVRVQNEAVLRENAERFQAFMDYSPMIAFLKDEQGRYAYVNQPFLQTFQLKADEILGFDDVHLWPELAPQMREGEHDVLSGHGIVSFLQAQSGADGTLRHWQMYKFPLQRGGGEKRFVAGIALDVSESKAHQQQLEEYQLKLQAALIHKDVFVSVVSHELRTPLTSIHGSLGLLIGGALGALPEGAVSMLEVAQRNSNQLLAVLNDILDLQKMESGRLEFHCEELELEPLVRGAVEANESYASQMGVSLVLVEAMSGLLIRADKARLIQVLSNLLSNAVKFSPEGGEVTVQAKASGDRSGHNVARVTVHDNGPGIPEPLQGQIFDKFAQAHTSTNRRHKGTGLGLSICKQIVEQMGGEIGFETNSQHGTTFYFEFPLLNNRG